MFSGDYTFLSTKPDNRLMSKDHPEILKVLPHADNNPYTLDAKVTKIDTSTADYEIDSITAREGEVYTFNIGWNDVAYPDKANIRKIEIYMGGPAGYATADDIITFYPFTIKSDHIIALYYQNSFGGIDSVFCKGDQVPEQDNDGIAARSGVTLAKDADLRQYLTVNTSARLGNLVHTGFSSRKELRALQDLFLHNYAYEYMEVGGEMRFVPIQVDPAVRWPSVRTNLQALPIRYRYATEHRSINRIS